MAGSLAFGRTALIAAIGLLLASPTALAQDADDAERNAARTLAGQAKESFDRGDYQKAQDLFHRAYQLVKAPTISLYEARALVKLGRLVEAEEAYTRTVRTPLDAQSSDQFRKAVRDAEPELVSLQPRIPRLLIQVTGPGASDADLRVAIDGEPLKSALLGVEMPINPGTHALTAQAGTGPATLETVSILEKERKSVELVVAAAPSALEAPPPTLSAKRADLAPPPPARMTAPWQRTASFVAGGVGVAGLGIGIVTGVMAASRYSKAEELCPGHRCVEGSAGDDAVQSFRSLRTVSTVGYVVGGVGLATGITLFVTAPTSKAQPAKVGVFVNAAQAGVAGVF